MMNDHFEMQDFLPYLLAQAAEAAGQSFQQVYKGRYGMARNDWRVLFHLGRYGAMTAAEIGQRAGLHKTMISRAVTRLETDGLVTRTPETTDRRRETLSLTTNGAQVYGDLAAAAEAYQRRISDMLGEDGLEALTGALRTLKDMKD